MRAHSKKTFQKKKKQKKKKNQPPRERNNVEIRKAIAVPSNNVARKRWIFS